LFISIVHCKIGHYDNLSNDNLSNRQFIENTYLVKLSQDIITAWSPCCNEQLQS